MNYKRVTFEQLGIEKELLDNLNEINMKYCIGPQVNIIKKLCGELNDVIIQSPGRTGKTTGYLIPIINEALKRRTNKSEKKCVGIILVWTSLMVKNIKIVADALCSNLPISIVYGDGNKLAVNSINDNYFIIISKAKLFQNNSFLVKQFFNSIRYLVVDQAAAFLVDDKKDILKDILEMVKSSENKNYSIVCSEMDFKGDIKSIKDQFLNSKFPYEIKSKMALSYSKDSDDESYSSDYEVESNSINKEEFYERKLFSKNHIDSNLEVVISNRFEIEKNIIKIIEALFDGRKDINIIIYMPTKLCLRSLEFYFKPLKISYFVADDFQQNCLKKDFHNICLICDNEEKKVPINFFNKICIHYFVPDTLIYKRRIENQKYHGNYIKSILVDEKEFLIKFLEELKL
uniref:ATP-dependent RNA helicase n=1 Tax=Parastrongyloides trichosuri TaxID=131310 RepID=A0A0N4ZD15_PARTI